MPKTLTQLKTLYGQLTNNSQTTNLSYGETLINDEIRRISGEEDWPFIQKSSTAVTLLGINFDAQTVNFTIGLTVTGSTSGAHGVIVNQTDSGTTGQLQVSTVTGTFRDNETITDTGGGSATVNGTPSGVQFYNLPNDLDQLISVTIQTGSNIYTPIEAPTREFWDNLNITTYNSNYPEWYFIFNGQLGFWPTPSTADQTITYSYDQLVKNLSIADYTTGTLSVTINTVAVTGSGTTWTSAMVGRWIQITPTDSATTSGDGFWYQISSVTSATALILTKPYTGATVSGGAYTLGQVSFLPDPYQDMPVYWAVHIYYSSVQPDLQRANNFLGIYERMHTGLKEDYAQKTTSPRIKDNYQNRNLTNGNLYPMNVGL